MSSERFSSQALEYARRHGGKVELSPKVPIGGLDDFAVWYTPGVAALSLAINQRPELSFEYTNRWNTIAIISDGSRVLGLGPVGPEASLPVMEGKALIFKYLGGVDALPLPVSVKEPEAIVQVAAALEPALGGVNLEDIESPKCFQVLEELRKRLSIPVWHDDQLGTAGVALAALLGALEVAGRRLTGSKVAMLGAGAANIATVQILAAAGADLGDIVVVDSRGILHPERDDIDELLLKNPWKYKLAIETNRARIRGGPAEAMRDADVLIAASTPGPGVVKKEWVSAMARDPIVFALANPVPEIPPAEAKEAGAGVVATGRSDYPNQVNNSLVFPGVFRGVLDVRAKAILDEMVVAAAREIHVFTKERGLTEEHIVASMEEWEVYPRVAAAVGAEASRLGLARRPMSKDELYTEARSTIERSRRILSTLMNSGLVPPAPRAFSPR